MTRIIIFAKALQPGFAKTRLIPALGQEGAARLARRMLEETLCCAIEAEIGPVELCTTPEIVSPSWLGINIPNRVKISTQGDGDLGARLARAVQRGIENGDSVLLIGTDCVEMSALLLREAAAALEHNVAVIHVTTDGGYALLGLTQFHPPLFKDVAWSTHCVVSETISRIEQLGWSLQIDALLHDVDEPEDLVHVPANWLRTFHA